MAYRVIETIPTVTQEELYKLREHIYALDEQIQKVEDAIGAELR